MQEKEQIEILRDLVSDYNEGKVSALVGAGFSKNVSQEYPSWTELLEDMYKDVYSEDIEIYYQNYLHCNPNALQSEVDTKKDYIKKRLKTEDLLALVSKYIKRKGYRECVDIYIEEHTPHVSEKDGKLILTYNDRNKELTKSDLAAQLELVKCNKFLNIYTTNYDTLIETANKLSEEKFFEEEAIVSSARLSNCVNKRNIIKIHGSLRQSDDEEYGFDGDNNLCYIIAKEDYDNYFNKHEAFSYMMRIAMLSGKFCLLGFSGTDANYLAWLNWMRDIIVKNGKPGKIYLISVDDSSKSKDMALFNHNHYIEIINLWDETILKVIGVSDKEITEYRKDKYKNVKNVIKAFLAYLNSCGLCGSEKSDNLPGNQAPIEVVPQSSYKKLWLELSDKIQNKETFTQILDEVVRREKDNRLFKIVYPMERVISFYERRSEFTEEEARAFSFAVKCSCKLPCFFSDQITNNEILQNCEIWETLLSRYDTINGNFNNIEENVETSSYENIVRSLFSLNFSKAKKEIVKWSPSDYHIQHHSMLLALYKEYVVTARENIRNYIVKESTPKREKLFASNIGNYISGEWLKRPYDCSEYYEQGIDGLGDIQAFILQELGPKREKPNTLDWIGKTYKFGYNNSNIRNSLKFLQFLIEGGIFPNYYGTYFLAIEDWYAIAHNLLEYFPYPCFFYSCMYNDKNVLRRIGQEFAYNKKLNNTNKALILKSLEALVNPDTPPLFVPGLYIMSGRIYRSVDEDVWFDLFKTNIIELYFGDMANLTSNEELLENLKMGIGALKNRTHIEYVFKNALKHFEEAPDVVCSLIENNLSLKRLDGKLDAESEELIMHIIRTSSSDNIYELIYRLNSQIELSTSILEALKKRIDTIPDSNLPKDPNTLIDVILLLPQNSAAQKRYKRQFLHSDIWFCGLMDNGKGITAPIYIRLNFLQDRITWDDEEFNCIKTNLESNVNKYKQIADTIHFDSYMRAERIQYFSDIKQYIDRLPKQRKDSLKYVYDTVTEFLADNNSGYSFEKELLSTQSGDVSSAIKLLEAEIYSYGLQNRLDEFQLLMDRALLMQTCALKTTLGTIKHVVCQNFGEIKRYNLTNKLLRILRLYRQEIVEFNEMNIDLYWTYNPLYAISKCFQENGIDDENITFWLTDEWVLKFISPEVL